MGEWRNGGVEEWGGRTREFSISLFSFSLFPSAFSLFSFPFFLLPFFPSRVFLRRLGLIVPDGVDRVDRGGAPGGGEAGGRGDRQ